MGINEKQEIIEKHSEPATVHIDNYADYTSV